MAADAIVYCLENLTDYAQFERLSHDLMLVEGYKGLEPLGGWQDKGRDAINVGQGANQDTSIFAYSVREDWFAKLKEDAAKVHKHGHECQNLVLVCTAFFSASQRDNAIVFIRETYGWKLHIYGIERIRTVLSTNQKLLTSHPQIFCPPFFPVAGGLTLALSPEHIVVDYSESDEVVAAWVARKLKCHGFLVWCRAIDPVAGESINDTTQALVETRAFVYVPVLSDNSVYDADFTFRRNSAYQAGKSRGAAFVIPILLSQLDDSLIDSNLRKIKKIDFDDGLQPGLSKLIQRLESLNCPISSDANSCALNSFFPVDIVSNTEETLISNVYSVLGVPETIGRYISGNNPSYEEIAEISERWAFRKVRSDTFLSFHPPPEDVEKRYGFKKAGGAAWQHVDHIDHISPHHLVIELIKKSLNLVCSARGLVLCPKKRKYFFPAGLLNNDRVSFKRPDGRSISISVVGERSFKIGGKDKYRYHLSPDFYVKRMGDDSFFIVVRIYLRLTDVDGTLLEGRKVNTRRKHLCKNWWNNDWLSRVMAVMQFLGDGQNIVVGTVNNKKVSYGIFPLSYQVPVSINEDALSEQSYTRDYLDLDLSNTVEENDEESGE
jgi:hypothetical protein